MGFTKDAVLFLLHCRARGADFSSCATIGRQVLYLNGRELRKVFSRNGQRVTPAEASAVFESGGNYAEPLLRLLGANTVDSYDASAYESATNVVDFNDPLSEDHKTRYTAVIDGGSLEHVFNFPQGLENAMEMVRPGGHLILITPTHSRSGHGFYQVSPELFHRTLCESNGYEPPEVLVSASRGDVWYRVADPTSVGGRVAINPKLYSDHLFVFARRSRVVPIFEEWPQQSDYAAAWAGGSTHTSPDDGFRARFRGIRHRIPRPFLNLYARLASFRSGSPGLQRIDL